MHKNKNIGTFIGTTIGVFIGTTINGLKNIFNVLFRIYKERVISNGGAVQDDNITNSWYNNIPQQDSIEFAWFGETGSIIRDDGIYDTFAKIYDLSPNNNDGTQTTESLQPYVIGNIAPVENIVAKNPTGDTNSFDIPEITIVGAYTITKHIQDDTTGKFITTFTEGTNLTISSITFTGSLAALIIRSGSLTAGEKTIEETYLATYYPEIPTVQIGALNVVTSNLDITTTAMDFLIPNVTLAADWANSLVLYNAAISGGATEYEALQAAAMWCYYNNDIQIGSVYNKLYNGFAKLLIKADIEAYNIANPSTPWGWHIVTEADWDDLDTAIGGDTDKIKENSQDYWLTNTGTNETGFTALPAGWRDTDGTFYELNETAAFWDAEDETLSEGNILGMSIRLGRSNYGI